MIARKKCRRLAGKIRELHYLWDTYKDDRCGESIKRLC